MTWVDAAIAIIFLYFIFTAFTAGFVREVIGMTAAIGGILLAGIFYDDLATSLFSSLDNETTASVISFLIIFLGITLAGQLVALIVQPAVTLLHLGVFDQMVGGAFGAVKGLIVIQVLLVLFVTYPRYDIDQKINDSNFAPLLLDVSTPVTTILPDIFEKKVDAFNG